VPTNSARRDNTRRSRPKTAAMKARNTTSRLEPNTRLGEASRHAEIDKNAELVFGIVAAVGTDIQQFQSGLSALLKHYNYLGNPVRLSDFLRLENRSSLDSSNEYSRISSLMSAGTKVRKSERGDILALYAAAKIASQRTKVGKRNAPQPRTAHILTSLKHPDEVSTLRQIYGSGFFLIGVYAPEDERLTYLTQRKGMSETEARILVKRDQDEGEELGQKTREVFHRSDVFVHFRHEDNSNRELERFLDLVFGDPFQTPNQDEHAMFLAFSSALRSADLSRQVGAVVTSAHGDVIALGANDVPQAGGGLYWPGSRDRRDFVLGFDSNDLMRSKILEEIMRKFPGKKKSSARSLISSGKKLFGDSIILDLTEFGRPVHAEMDALLTCARSGISPRGGTLYSTTFPCHNCAKHIVHAGICRVVYVEPYPKSKAGELYADSVSIDGTEADRVAFVPFVGVGPRRYFDLFSMKLGSGYDSKRKQDGRKISWDRGVHGGPRIPMLPTSYIDREKINASAILPTISRVKS
jgi:deoxycytidylate deaminase